MLDQTYHGTLVERELKALLARGGVLAGDSAGSITLGCFWLAWNSRQQSLERTTEGLCTLPRVTVTPHIQKIDGDEQTADIRAYIVSHPETIGINISENTMLVLRESIAEVLGVGGVTIFDTAKDNTKPYLRLFAGTRYDLTK